VGRGGDAGFRGVTETHSTRDYMSEGTAGKSAVTWTSLTCGVIELGAKPIGLLITKQTPHCGLQS
jgi:hypothetical protein